MSDVRCTVCGEPWDYCGMLHGDMEKWEADLFKQGAGCPSCQGELPEKPFEPERLSDIENGDDDPMLRINAWENRDNRPKWEEPKPTTLWTCAGCGVEAQRNANGELFYHLPRNAKAAQWYNSHPFHSSEPEATPHHVFKPNRPVCEFCHSTCYHCGADISDTLETGDVYDDGASFPYETYHAICVDCLEAQCGECGAIGEDCTCHDE